MSPLLMSKLLIGITKNQRLETSGMNKQQLLQVKCYSGHTYAQRPESFWLDKEYKISRIEDEWQEPSKKFFRVLTEDEMLFELCYNEAQDQWWLIR